MSDTTIQNSQGYQVPVRTVEEKTDRNSTGSKNITIIRYGADSNLTRDEEHKVVAPLNLVS